MIRKLVLPGMVVALFLAGTAARAADPSYTLTIKDHKFDPAQIEVPANTKLTLIVHNADPTAEEFESSRLHREKIVPGGQKLTLPLGPLPPGRYEFVGDFHRQTAHGVLIVK